MVTDINKYVSILKTNISSNKVLRIFLTVLIPAYILDQATKSIVVMTMSEYEVRELFPWLYWRYLRNSGAAFSLGESLTLVYTMVMLLVAVGIFFLIRRVNNVGWGIGLALVAAGSAGNLTDRLFRQPGWGSGYVVDFISIGNFAVFNIADMCVCFGMVLLCFLVVRGVSSGVTLQPPAAREVTSGDTLDEADNVEKDKEVAKEIVSDTAEKNDERKTGEEAEAYNSAQVDNTASGDGEKEDADGDNSKAENEESLLETEEGAGKTTVSEKTAPKTSLKASLLGQTGGASL